MVESWKSPGGVELKLAEDVATNNGKQKLSINDLRNPSIVSKTAVMRYF
jgi:hypothetical protein